MRPTDTVEKILEEFRQFQRTLRKTQDYMRFHNDFERWKRRASSSLAPIIPAADLEKFYNLPIEPDLELDEEDAFELLIDVHDAYLVSLFNDMQKHPESYREKVAGKHPASLPVVRAPSEQAQHEASPSLVTQQQPLQKASSLELPEKITLSWLAQHVPVRFWFVFGGLLVGAFLLGVRLAKVFGPLLGMGPP